MQQESKIGFLWQYVIACIHPSQYKELIKKKKGAFVGYVAVLVMFLVLIENVIPFAACKNERCIFHRCHEPAKTDWRP